MTKKEGEEDVRKVDPPGSFPEAFRIGSPKARCIFLLLLPLLHSNVSYTKLMSIRLICMIWMFFVFVFCV